MDDLLNKELLTIILKSERYLKIAQGLANQGDYDVACSKAFYSVFYIMEGLLLRKGLKFSNNTSLMDAFNKYFIDTGELSKDLYQKVNNLFEQRQIAENNLDKIITHEMAYEDVYIAGTILEECKKYLIDSSFI